MSQTPNRARGGDHRGPDTRIIAIVAAVLVAIVAVTAVVVSGGDDGDDGDTASSQFGAVTVSGEPLPGLPPVGDDPAVGATAPALTSERPGETVTVEPATDGTPTMLVFLAHWCPHCRAELPVLVEMAQAGVFDDIRTVAVLTSSDPDRPNFPPSDWLDSEGWQGDRLFDDRESSAGAAYGVTEFPFTVFVDAEGNVTERFGGRQPAERIASAVETISR